MSKDPPKLDFWTLETALDGTNVIGTKGFTSSTRGLGEGLKDTTWWRKTLVVLCLWHNPIFSCFWINFFAHFSVSAALDRCNEISCCKRWAKFPNKENYCHVQTLDRSVLKVPKMSKCIFNFIKKVNTKPLCEANQETQSCEMSILLHGAKPLN